jgi:hypothetical protein
MRTTDTAPLEAAAVGSPMPRRARRSRKPSRKLALRNKTKRFRSIPPPPSFDLYQLAQTQILTTRECAAVIRRSTETLVSWRWRKPDHPLKWRRLAGRRIGYVVCDVRAYLES